MSNASSLLSPIFQASVQSSLKIHQDLGSS